MVSLVVIHARILITKQRCCFTSYQNGITCLLLCYIVFIIYMTIHQNILSLVNVSLDCTIRISNILLLGTKLRRMLIITLHMRSKQGLFDQSQFLYIYIYIQCRDHYGLTIQGPLWSYKTGGLLTQESYNLRSTGVL